MDIIACLRYQLIQSLKIVCYVRASKFLSTSTVHLVQKQPNWQKTYFDYLLYKSFDYKDKDCLKKKFSMKVKKKSKKKKDGLAEG